MMKSKKGSLPSVRSGLKSWVAFANMVLGLPLEEVMPPRTDDQVLMWLACHRNAGTARNYVGYLEFACKVLDLDTAWRSERVHVMIEGMKKSQILGILPRTVKVIIDQENINKIVCY